MSTDTFEDTLRGLLQEAADGQAPAYLDLGPQIVLGRGRRVVRRRRTAVGLAAAAAVLAIAGVSAVAVGTGQGRAATVPAGPAVARSRVVATVQMDLPSLPLPGGVVVNDGKRTVPVPPKDPTRIVVDVDEAARSWRVATLDSEGRRTPGPLEALPANPRFTTWWTPGGAEGLVVGVLPAAATDVVTVWSGTAVPDSSVALAALAGTSRQVFAVRHATGGRDGGFLGLDWTDGTDVYDSVGGRVSSARSGTDLVFVDRLQGVFGIFGAGTTSTKRLSDVPAGALPVLMSGEVPEGADTMETTVLLVLPAGARAVQVVATAGATLRSSQSFNDGTTGDTLVVARLSVPTRVAGTGVDRVTWTATDGSSGSSTVRD